MRFPFYGGPLDGDVREVAQPAHGGLHEEYLYAMTPRLAAADYACTGPEYMPTAAELAARTPIYRYILRRRVGGQLLYVWAGLDL